MEMNIEQALIIKTKNHFQTGQAKKVRDLLRCFDEGQDVVVVPYDAKYLLITMDDTDGNQLSVFIYDSEDDEMDIVKGFDSVQECIDYTKLVISEAGLPEDSYDRDVWEVEEESEDEPVEEPAAGEQIMMNQEVEEFKELRDKALEKELTKEEVKRFVELTNMAIEACVDEVETIQEERDYVVVSWKDIDLVNRIQNAFIEELDLKEEFKEFLAGYKEKSEETEETTESKVIH
jgi:hypothetical protein